MSVARPEFPEPRQGPAPGIAAGQHPLRPAPFTRTSPNGPPPVGPPGRSGGPPRIRPPAPPYEPRPYPPDDEPTVVHDQVAAPIDGPVPDVVPGTGSGRHRAGGPPDGPPPETGGGRGGRRRRSSFWRELPLLLVVALVLTFLIQTFLAKVYVIPSGSMETTLHGCTGCTNDRVLVDKVTYRFAEPRPGEVVVFRGPDSWSSEISVEEPSNPLVRGLQQLGSLVGIAPPDEKDFVKRIIAVGGQTVQCCDGRNRVLVDGEPLEEPYVHYLPAAGAARQAPFGPITVPEGELWMMGDSRNNSADSRAPDHGPVPVENVIGVARAVVLPVARFRWVDVVDPQSVSVGMPAPVGGHGGGAPLALGLLGALTPLTGRGAVQRATGPHPDPSA